MSDQVAMVLGEIVILVMTCWMYPKVYQARIVSILNYHKLRTILLLLVTVVIALAVLIGGLSFIGYVFISRSQATTLAYRTEPILLGLTGLFIVEIILQIIILNKQNTSRS